MSKIKKKLAKIAEIDEENFVSFDCHGKIQQNFQEKWQLW